MTFGPRHLFVIALGAITFIPLATTSALFRSIDDEGRFVEQSIDQRSRAIEDRSGSFRYRRRAYSRAMVEFRKRRQAGEKDLLPPDINNIESYESYLREIEKQTAERESLHSAPPVKQAPSIEKTQVREHPVLNTRTLHENIGRRERLLLQFYRDAGFCPDPLVSTMPEGFQMLCERLIKEKDKAPKLGFISDLANMKMRNAPPPATVKRRLEMIKQAHDRSNRRTDVAPTNYLRPQ